MDSQSFPSDERAGCFRAERARLFLTAAARKSAHRQMTQDRFELQNFTSWTAGNHFLKVGARLRHVQIDSISPGNFGGTYTFARRTWSTAR